MFFLHSSTLALLYGYALGAAIPPGKAPLVQNSTYFEIQNVSISGDKHLLPNDAQISSSTTLENVSIGGTDNPTGVGNSSFLGFCPFGDNDGCDDGCGGCDCSLDSFCPFGGGHDDCCCDYGCDYCDDCGYCEYHERYRYGRGRCYHEVEGYDGSGVHYDRYDDREYGRRRSRHRPYRYSVVNNDNQTVAVNSTSQDRLAWNATLAGDRTHVLAARYNNDTVKRDSHYCCDCDEDEDDDFPCCTDYCSCCTEECSCNSDDCGCTEGNDFDDCCDGDCGCDCDCGCGCDCDGDCDEDNYCEGNTNCNCSDCRSSTDSGLNRPELVHNANNCSEPSQDTDLKHPESTSDSIHTEPNQGNQNKGFGSDIPEVGQGDNTAEPVRGSVSTTDAGQGSVSQSEPNDSIPNHAGPNDSSASLAEPNHESTSFAEPKKDSDNRQEPTRCSVNCPDQTQPDQGCVNCPDQTQPNQDQGSVNCPNPIQPDQDQGSVNCGCPSQDGTHSAGPSNESIDNTCTGAGQGDFCSNDIVQDGTIPTDIGQKSAISADVGQDTSSTSITDHSVSGNFTADAGAVYSNSTNTNGENEEVIHQEATFVDVTSARSRGRYRPYYDDCDGYYDCDCDYYDDRYCDCYDGRRYDDCDYYDGQYCDCGCHDSWWGDGYNCDGDCGCCRGRRYVQKRSSTVERSYYDDRRYDDCHDYLSGRPCDCGCSCDDSWWDDTCNCDCDYCRGRRYLQKRSGPGATSIDTSSLGMDSVRQSAGYVDVAEGKNSLFYWYFESRNNPKADPVVLWLNGGPGCSSLKGALWLNGPSTVTKDNELKHNPYSWNNNSNIIFLDEPGGAGFSTVTEDVSTTREAANQVYEFLDIFFTIHPELQGKPLHVAGISDAGHILAELGALVLSKEEKKFDLGSVIIGNGLIDTVTQYQYLQPMLCGKGGQEPALSEEKCNEMAKTSDKCMSQLKKSISGELHNNTAIMSYCNKVTIEQDNKNFMDLQQPCADNEEATCYWEDDHIAQYLNQPHVLNLLQSKKSKFVACNATVDLSFDESGSQLASNSANLTAVLEADIPVLIYAGDTDALYNWLGNKKVAEELTWKNHENFKNAESIPWVVSGKEEGSVKNYKHLTFLRIYNTGHLVTDRKPEAGLAMFNTWISGNYKLNT